MSIATITSFETESEMPTHMSISAEDRKQIILAKELTSLEQAAIEFTHLIKGISECNIEIIAKDYHDLPRAMINQIGELTTRLQTIFKFSIDQNIQSSFKTALEHETHLPNLMICFERLQRYIDCFERGVEYRGKVTPEANLKDIGKYSRRFLDNSIIKFGPELFNFNTRQINVIDILNTGKYFENAKTTFLDKGSFNTLNCPIEIGLPNPFVILAINELFSNARKATSDLPPGQELRILSATLDEQKLVIKLHDNGQGYQPNAPIGWINKNTQTSGLGSKIIQDLGMKFHLEKSDLYISYDGRDYTMSTAQVLTIPIIQNES